MLDLKELAREYVEIAKENLQRDGHLVPVVALVTDQGIELIPVLNFKNTSEKRRRYRVISAYAKRVNAIAAILINDAWWKETKSWAEVAYHDHVGLQTDPDHQEAIVIIVKARDSEGYMLLVPYRREGGQLVFEEPVEGGAGTRISIDFDRMMPDW